jgi:PAS domain-containing protein
MATRNNQDHPDFSVPEWITRFVADIPSAVAVFDNELRYVAANNRWLNAFGVVGDGLIGQSHDQIDPQSAPTLIDLHRRALSGETAEACLGDDSELTEGACHRVVSVRPHRDDAGGARDRYLAIPSACDRRADRTCRPPLLHGPGALGHRLRQGSAPTGRDLSARHR